MGCKGRVAFFSIRRAIYQAAGFHFDQGRFGGSERLMRASGWVSSVPHEYSGLPL